MGVWVEKKNDAIKENNVILYNSMLNFEKHGDVGVLIDVIEGLSRENKELKNVSLTMNKNNILKMIQGFKKLAIIDFTQLSEDEKEEGKEYQRGYINALNMVYEQLSKNI